MRQGWTIGSVRNAVNKRTRLRLFAVADRKQEIFESDSMEHSVRQRRICYLLFATLYCGRASGEFALCGN
jgi:hypothetical protein